MPTIDEVNQEGIWVCFKFLRVDSQVRRSTHSPGHNDRYHLAYFWHSFAPSPFSAAHLQTMVVQSYLTSHRHDIWFFEFNQEICNSTIPWEVTWADIVGVDWLLVEFIVVCVAVFGLSSSWKPPIHWSSLQIINLMRLQFLGSFLTNSRIWRQFLLSSKR